MKSNRSAIFAILSVLLLVLLVIGGFLVSLAEGGYTAYSVPGTLTTATATGMAFPTQPVDSATPVPLTATFTSTATKTLTPSSTPTGTLTQTDTQTPTPTFTLTLTYTATHFILTASPSRTYTFVPTFCGPPYGWVPYVVQRGDTLFSISLRLGISLYQLEIANCIQNPDYIQAGYVIFVPYIPAPILFTSTATHLPTATRIPTATPRPSATHTLPPTSSPAAIETDTPPATAEPTGFPYP